MHAADQKGNFRRRMMIRMNNGEKRGAREFEIQRKENIFGGSECD